MPPPLGDVGEDDPPPHAANSVASVAPDAAWQAPAQNRRRETAVVVSDIVSVLVWEAGAEGAISGPLEGRAVFRTQDRSAGID